jgi:fumarylacetoacetase
LLEYDNREIRDIWGLAERALIPMPEAELLLPVEVGDYVDFYSSLEHASNLGKMFRPDQPPLLPNWRYLPVGYHGRSSSIVVSDSPIRRPFGQLKIDDGPPVWSPTRALDFELEVGFVTGVGNELSRSIPVDVARDHIFGLVLVNDWSARDVQRWEYVPLGPYLGKSFATSISPWVVPLDAIAPYLVPAPVQEPEPLEYLRERERRGLDLKLEVRVASEWMTEEGIEPSVISRVNFRDMYWTMAQQLAHATSNGTNARTGDLYASGTVSGSEPATFGSMIELAWRGTRPIELADGSKRVYLEDGDTVVMRGLCGGDGRPRVGFGDVRGTIAPALP